MYDDDVDALLARRRASKSNRTTLLVFALVGGAAILTVLFLVVVLVSRNRDGRGGPPVVGGAQQGGGPSVAPAFGPDVDRMTYREMYDHLRSRGVRIEWAKGDKGIYFVRPGVDPDSATLFAEGRDLPWPDDVVRVEQMPNAEAARQSAGTSLKKTFAHRRWLFVGDERLLAEIRSSLGG